METYYTIELYDETVASALDELSNRGGSFQDAAEMLVKRFRYTEWAADMIVNDYLARYANSQV